MRGLMVGVFLLLNGVYMYEYLAVLIIILAISTLIEIAVLVYFWQTSDIKECNWLFCSFGKVEKSVEEIKNYSLIQECYKNNVKVNCSDLK